MHDTALFFVPICFKLHDMKSLIKWMRAISWSDRRDWHLTLRFNSCFFFASASPVWPSIYCLHIHKYYVSYMYIYIYRSFLFDFGYQIIRLVKAGLWHLLICHKQGILCVNINGDKRWCELSCQKFLDLGMKSKMSLGSYLNPQVCVQNNL